MVNNYTNINKITTTCSSLRENNNILDYWKANKFLYCINKYFIITIYFLQIITCSHLKMFLVITLSALMRHLYLGTKRVDRLQVLLQQLVKVLLLFLPILSKINQNEACTNKVISEQNICSYNSHSRGAFVIVVGFTTTCVTSAYYH